MDSAMEISKLNFSGGVEGRGCGRSNATLRQQHWAAAHAACRMSAAGMASNVWPPQETVRQTLSRPQKVTAGLTLVFRRGSTRQRRFERYAVERIGLDTDNCSGGNLVSRYTTRTPRGPHSVANCATTCCKDCEVSEQRRQVRPVYIKVTPFDSSICMEVSTGSIIGSLAPDRSAPVRTNRDCD